MAVTVVSWNIATRREPWRQLLGMDADIALLQEATPPPDDVARLRDATLPSADHSRRLSVARASGSGRNGRPGCSLRITCWEQHRPRATTTIPTDKVAGQSATDEVAGHYLGGSILARRSCESTSRRWVNPRSAVRRTGTWWVRLPSAIPGHFSVGVDTGRWGRILYGANVSYV